MTPTKTAEVSGERVVPARIPLLPGDPEGALIDEVCRDLRLPTAVAEAGPAVRSTTASAPVNEFAEADAAKRRSDVIARYSKGDLLCLDEFGYLNLDKKGAKLLFHIFTEREERKATAVASHAWFSEWDETFTDPRLCPAIADRLTFKETLVQTGTDSYRLKATENEYRSAGRS
ncbi:hypothetical protein GCM10010211_34060 [Streptomyces albospinus]|uniref:IstB-like ATP-binding domain-containing protein n=1 Tax=Streptomyces albospinus TaxID=285515 RepID=A0ABQ2V2L2_9ACTN|nr:ATP-binding protein [Streptomyces albospinus]GGU66024.1 hypothetical protein GCM10010211_34060 [Streptomyces albospinus]